MERRKDIYLFFGIQAVIALRGMRRWQAYYWTLFGVRRQLYSRGDRERREAASISANQTAAGAEATYLYLSSDIPLSYIYVCTYHYVDRYIGGCHEDGRIEKGKKTKEEFAREVLREEKTDGATPARRL